MDILFAELQARNARECFGLVTVASRAAVQSSSSSPNPSSAERQEGHADLESRAKIAEQLETIRCLRRDGEKLAAEVTRLKRALEERDQVVKDCNTTVQSLQDELHLANLELSQADRQIAKLKDENETLVQRWIARINMEADRG